MHDEDIFHDGFKETSMMLQMMVHCYINLVEDREVWLWKKLKQPTVGTEEVVYIALCQLGKPS